MLYKNICEAKTSHTQSGENLVKRALYHPFNISYWWHLKT